jgi:hypothetical protein
MVTLDAPNVTWYGKMTNKVLMIDPPSGWKYGFPKVMPDPRPEDTHAWLIANGYPEKEILSCGDHFYCRYWETKLEETDDR